MVLLVDLDEVVVVLEKLVRMPTIVVMKVIVVTAFKMLGVQALTSIMVEAVVVVEEILRELEAKGVVLMVQRVVLMVAQHQQILAVAPVVVPIVGIVVVMVVRVSLF